jgi:hypothetical protein
VTYFIKPLDSTYDVAEKFSVPKKGCAKALVLVVDENTNTAIFHLNASTVTLNCNLQFEGVTIDSAKPISFNIGTNALILQDSAFVNGIQNIKGAGNNKINKDGTINTVITNGTYLINKNIESVACLYMMGADVTVGGVVNIGTVGTEGTDNHLTGSATVKKDKFGVVSTVTSNINIENGIDRADEEGIVDIKLSLDETLDYSKAINSDKPTFMIFKSKNGYINVDNDKPRFIYNSGKMLIRKGGAYYYNEKILNTVPGFVLQQNGYDDEGNVEVYQHGIYQTYADVLADIKNMQKTSGEYTIIANTETGEKKHPVENYSIPTHKNITSITIKSKDASIPVTLNSGKAAMTIKTGTQTEVILEDINFTSDKTVDIEVGKNGVLQAKDCTIGNLRNVKANSGDPTLIFEYTSPTKVQNYSGKLTVNAKTHENVNANNKLVKK